MPITPEQSQKVTNINQRVLANVAAGKPPHDGITQNEVKEALDILRGDRARALIAGEKKPGKVKKEKKASAAGQNLDAVLAAKFPGMNFD